MGMAAVWCRVVPVDWVARLMSPEAPYRATRQLPPRGSKQPSGACEQTDRPFREPALNLPGTPISFGAVDLPNYARHDDPAVQSAHQPAVPKID